MRKSKKNNLMASTILFLILLLGIIIGFSFKKTKEIEVQVPVFIERTVEVEKPVIVEEQTTIEDEFSGYEHFDVIATAYCPCVKCCGKSDGITATGTKAKEGRTIAADPSVLPYGSKVIIGEITYTVEDCGGSIKQNKIDVFFDSHQEALQWGVQNLTVLVKRCEK